MSECQRFSNLRGTLGQWVICSDIPVSSPKGVIYQYPKEKQNLIKDGDSFTCIPDKYPVFLIKVANLVKKAGLSPVDNSIVSARTYSLDIPMYVFGNIQSVKVANPGLGVYSRLYSHFNVIVKTDMGTYVGQLGVQDDSGAVSVTISNYNGLGLPYNNADPNEEYRNLRLSGDFDRIAGQGLSAAIGSKQKVDEIVTPESKKIFTIYKEGPAVFSRTAKVCPGARLQSGSCLYTGNPKVVATPNYNNQHRAYLECNFYTQGDKKCVRVFKVTILGPTADPFAGYLSRVLLYDDCSPSGCELFPKITSHAAGGGAGPPPCPPGSCTVICGNELCCYDPVTGGLITGVPDSTAPYVGYNNPSPGQTQQTQQQYIVLNYDNPDIGSDTQTTNNYFL